MMRSGRGCGGGRGGRGGATAGAATAASDAPLAKPKNESEGGSPPAAASPHSTPPGPAFPAIVRAALTEPLDDEARRAFAMTTAPPRRTAAPAAWQSPLGPRPVDAAIKPPAIDLEPESAVAAEEEEVAEEDGVEEEEEVVEEEDGVEEVAEVAEEEEARETEYMEEQQPRMANGKRRADAPGELESELDGPSWKCESQQGAGKRPRTSPKRFQAGAAPPPSVAHAARRAQVAKEAAEVSEAAECSALFLKLWRGARDVAQGCRPTP